MPITVTTLTVTGVASTASHTSCAPSAATFTTFAATDFSGSRSVTGTHGKASVPRPLTWKTQGTQDACENASFTFTYTGTATFTDGTKTTLAVSPGTSAPGTKVTFTATVTAADPTFDHTTEPGGTVELYECSSATTCESPTLLGTEALASTDKATYSTSSLPAGRTYVEAVYASDDENFSGSTSDIAAETVTSSSSVSNDGSETWLSVSPSPSLLGETVTLTARVTTANGIESLTGSVTFYSGTPGGSRTDLGTEALNDGVAILSTSSLPGGTDELYASYPGTSTYRSSTSPVVVEAVIGPRGVCAASGYANYVVGSEDFALYPVLPFFSLVVGTNGNDFIYLPSGSYLADGLNGNDCLFAGTGDDLLVDGAGNDGIAAGNGTDTVVAGKGADKVALGTGPRDTVTLGNGTDTVHVGNGRGDRVVVGSGNDTLVVGNGSALTVDVGNGRDEVTVGNGSKSVVTVGNGSDTVVVGKGSTNKVTLGNGTDPVTIAGSHDTITAGRGTKSIYLGSGTHNTFAGTSKTKDSCYVPKPPSSYHGTTPTGYYDDTVTNCTVETTRGRT